LNHSFRLTGLSASTTYYYNITSCDKAGNCVVNGTNNFTTSAVVIVNNNGGGGGGGGGITSMTYTPSLAETAIGYKKSLSKNDKIKFVVFDGGNAPHTMILDYVCVDFVNITFNSNPIKLSLGVGQNAKLNLSSADYYDLYVKLNSIVNNKADITIQTIHEKIPKTAEITGEIIEESSKKETEEKIPQRELKETFIYAVSLILIIIGIIILLRKKSRARKRESAKKEYQKKFKEIKPKK